jgi:hypothetical protein
MAVGKKPRRSLIQWLRRAHSAAGSPLEHRLAASVGGATRPHQRISPCGFVET